MDDARCGLPSPHGVMNGRLLKKWSWVGPSGDGYSRRVHVTEVSHMLSFLVKSKLTTEEGRKEGSVSLIWVPKALLRCKDYLLWLLYVPTPNSYPWDELVTCQGFVMP